MGVKRFEDLRVWQNARTFSNLVYQLTRGRSLRNDFGLTSQMQRASVSIMANIAEGFERGSNKEFINFLFIAKSSVAETKS
jgi:four helix bundle protein